MQYCQNNEISGTLFNRCWCVTFLLWFCRLLLYIFIVHNVIKGRKMPENDKKTFIANNFKTKYLNKRTEQR